MIPEILLLAARGSSLSEGSVSAVRSNSWPGVERDWADSRSLTAQFYAASDAGEPSVRDKRFDVVETGKNGYNEK